MDMKSLVKACGVSAVVASCALVVSAQQPAPNPKDPRIGLKGGWKDAGTAAPPPPGAGFTNSDLAFQGTHAIVGNYHGFNTYDVERDAAAALTALEAMATGFDGDAKSATGRDGSRLKALAETLRGRAARLR